MMAPDLAGVIAWCHTMKRTQEKDTRGDHGAMTYRIVQLEEGVWLAPWKGDPGRTLVRDSAKIFHQGGAAHKALTKARKNWDRDFPDAEIVPVHLVPHRRKT